MTQNEILPYRLTHLLGSEDTFIGKFHTKLGVFSRVNIDKVGEVYVKNLFKLRL